MPRDNQVYLMRFFRPASIARLPAKERAGSVRSYFNQCMKQIRPHLHGIEVVSRQEYLLSAALQGPKDSCAGLKHHLEHTRLGELIPDESVKVFGAAGLKRS